MEPNKDEQPAMKDWDFSPNNAGKMQDGKDKFRDKWATSSDGDKKKIMKYPGLARKRFAEWGGFYLEEDLTRPRNVKPIPLDAEFRVLDGSIMEGRQNLITLVLRDGQTPDQIKQELSDDEMIWQCTYNPYLKRKKPSRRAKKTARKGNAKKTSKGRDIPVSRGKRPAIRKT
jgi:hypothetical protein